MITVTKDEFFAALYADKRDIMPRSEPHQSTWEDKSRRVFGISTPGWKCEGPTTYKLAG